MCNRVRSGRIFVPCPFLSVALACCSCPLAIPFPALRFPLTNNTLKGVQQLNNQYETIRAAQPGQIVFLGHQGENLARRVIFDLSDLRERYPEGRFALAAQRKGDALPYPAARTNLDGSALIWTLTDTDTAVAGYGRCELRCYDGDTLAKSEVWNTFTLPALSACGEAPEAWEDYVERMQRLGQAVQEAQSHAPQIGEGGSWLLWNAAQGGYADTGLPARGERGEKGEKGDPGEAVIDATLTEPGEAADANVTGDSLRALGKLADTLTEKLDWNLIHWDFQQKTLLGVTLIVGDDGTLLVNGTSNTAHSYEGIKLLDAADIDHAQEYTVRRVLVDEDAPASGSVPYLWFGYGTSATSVTNRNGSSRFTIPEGCSLYLCLSKRTTFCNQRYLLQVYQGSDDLPCVSPEQKTAVDLAARNAARQGAKKPMLCSTEEAVTTTRNYSEGELLITGDTLYTVTANIASGAAIIEGVNVTPTTMAEQLAAGGESSGSITVDGALSASSMNPVQNKVVKAALDGKGATTLIPASASVDANGLISFKNADNTQLFTVQLPLYAGGVD